MKKTMTIFGMILFASTFLISCGGSTSDKPAETTAQPAETTEQLAAEATEETTEATAEETTEQPAAESGSDCDQFISDYEEFVDSYISVVKKMKANPSDATIMSEYTEMASKAATMQEDAGDCTDAKYSDKLAKLSTKMANAAAGM